VKNQESKTLAKLFQAMRSWTRIATSLGHQGGKRVFWEDLKFTTPNTFKVCPTHFSRTGDSLPL